MVFESSAMAIVICNDKILVTHELIYGNIRISLPKGHIEGKESVIDASIRETFEECGIKLAADNYVVNLEPFKINFINHCDEEVEKMVYPVLFKIDHLVEPLIQEKQILKVEYMHIDDFLKYCSYENVKKTVEEAFKILNN